MACPIWQTLHFGRVQENLLKEGLEIECEEGAMSLHFMKIHAPLELLKRYAEILKIRMPISVGSK